MRDDRTPEEEEKLRQASARADARWREGYITYLATRGHLRAIRQALTEKLTYSQIAAKIGVSEQRVADLAGLLTDRQSTDESAFEAIVRAHIEGTPRQELIQRLAAWEWPDAAYDPYAVPPKDWYRTHRDAVIQGLMTAAEVAEIDHMRSGAPGPYVPYVPPTAEEKEARRRQRAGEWLGRIRQRRAILKAVLAGSSVEDVALRFGERIGYVQSIVKWADAGAEEPGPEELITAAWLDPEADRRGLVERLAGWKYTADLVAAEGMEGRLRGSWTEVEHGYYAEMLSMAEYEEIERRRKPLLSHPSAAKYE